MSFLYITLYAFWQTFHQPSYTLGKYVTIPCAFILLLPYSKLSLCSNFESMQNKGKLLMALKLSWRNSCSHLFSFSRCCSLMHTSFYKCSLFWVQVQPALLFRNQVCCQCFCCYLSCLFKGGYLDTVTLVGLQPLAARCQPHHYAKQKTNKQLLLILKYLHISRYN